MAVSLRTVVLAPGDEVPCAAEEWADHLVVVESGELEVLCRTGTLARFSAGSVLAFAGLLPRALRNPADTAGAPLVLRAVSRRPTDEGPVPGTSHR